jgi:hypothetical protein
LRLYATGRGVLRRAPWVGYGARLDYERPFISAGIPTNPLTAMTAECESAPYVYPYGGLVLLRVRRDCGRNVPRENLNRELPTSLLPTYASNHSRPARRVSFGTSWCG